MIAFLANLRVRTLLAAPLSGLLSALVVTTACAQAGYWGEGEVDPSNASAFRQSMAECQRVRDLAPPASELPTPAETKSLSGCDAEALYYGIGMKADPATARLCAFMTKPDAGEPFSGPALLATIYANGKGAARDLDLAIHYACMIDGAPQEMSGRIEHLAGLKGKANLSGDFDYCDDITSGAAGGACAVRDARIADAERQAKLEAVTAGYSAEATAAYRALRKAEDAYADASSGGEVDLTGTLRGAFVTERDQSIRKTFARHLEALATGKAITAKTSFAKADERLNTVYRKLMKSNFEDYGSVDQDGVRQAERAWIAYRTAWTKFLAAAYPRADVNALKAALTMERTTFLQGFLN